MVRLHTLQAVDEDGLTFEVDGSVFRHNCAHAGIPGPEDMAHGAPGGGGVGAEGGGAVLRQLDCAVVGIEVELVLADVDARQLVR